MRRARVLACLFATLAMNCQDELTQMVVVVSTDLAPGADFVRIDVDVTGAEIVPDTRLGVVTDGSFARAYSEEDVERHVPFSFGLLPVDGVASVHVRAIDAHGRVLVEQSRRASFGPAATTKLRMRLDLACVGVGFECTEFRASTCIEGRCEAIDAAALPSVKPFHELDDVPAPPTPVTRLVQRSSTLLEQPVALGDAREATFTLGAEDLVTAAPMNASVFVSSFRVDSREVTIGRFRTFLDVLDEGMRGRIGYPDGTSRTFAAPTLPSSAVPGCTRILDFIHAESLSDAERNLPMACVDWHTAQAFCVFDGGRLPTSAEWEYVAHGRTGTAAALDYPWGNTPPATNGIDDCLQAWFMGCGDDSAPWPRPVARLPDGVQTSAAGPFVYDLAGNVAEWTADRYEPYSARNCWPPAPLSNPSCSFEGLDSDGGAIDEFVVIRGGAIAPVDGSDDGVTGLRAAATTPRRASLQSPYVGFRCVYDRLP